MRPTISCTTVALAVAILAACDGTAINPQDPSTYLGSEREVGFLRLGCQRDAVHLDSFAGVTHVARGSPS